MSEKEQYWERIQDLLDERRDPLGDEEVTAWLLEHPEELDGVIRMRAALAVLERTPRRVSRWRTIGLPIAAGIVGLLGLWGFAESGGPAGELPSPPGAETARLDRGPRIIEFRLSIVTENPDRRITTVFDGETFSRQVDHFNGDEADQASLLANTTLSTLTSRRCAR